MANDVDLEWHTLKTNEHAWTCEGCRCGVCTSSMRENNNAFNWEWVLKDRARSCLKD